MKEVYDSLVRMIRMNELVQKSTVPGEIKFKVDQAVKKALDFVIENTSQANINKLFIDEMRKRLNKKIKNDV